MRFLSCAVALAASADLASAQNYYNPNWRSSPYVSPYPGQRWVGPTTGPNRTFTPSGRGQMVPIAPNVRSLRYNVPPVTVPSRPSQPPSNSGYPPGTYSDWYFRQYGNPVSPSSPYGSPDNPIRNHGGN